MLARLAIELSESLAGARLDALRQEGAHRFRLAFGTDRVGLSVLVSLHPEIPWIGSAVRRSEGPRWSPGPFVVAAARALTGRRVDRVIKDSVDRTMRLDLGDGHGLAIELATHGPNLILLAEGATIVDAIRRPRVAHERLASGRRWLPRGFPAESLDPFAASAQAIDAFLAQRQTVGETLTRTLQRRFCSLGSAATAMVIEESLATGRSPGEILRERLDTILAGSSEVVIEGPEDPWIAKERGVFDPAHYRILPWRPGSARAGHELFARDRAAATAGYYYEAQEAASRLRAWIAALAGILSGELRRTRESEVKVRESLRSFEDPDRHRRMGEALLAGLSVARRAGDAAVVPDPYDQDGREIVVPAPPDRSLVRVADDLFQRHRRARRGLAAAGARAEVLTRRASRLEALLVAHGRAASEADADALEAAMRAEKLPVGLVGPTRASRAAARVVGPRLTGVRMMTSTDGWTILVGRTGRDNDRLTFKIAAPDDIWLHAAGVTGAHVIVRNPERRASAPDATLVEAARLAFWFSDARSQGVGDVQWTRRKNVRRAGGGASGTVALKRFESIRVRAQTPPDDL